MRLPLAGVAIGNGYIDAVEQMPWYAEMAYKNPHGIELVDEKGYEAMKRTAESCARDTVDCRSETDRLQKDLTCQKAERCSQVFFGPLHEKKISVYDISKQVSAPF